MYTSPNLDKCSYSRFVATTLYMQELDTEIVVATARGTTTNATAVSANIVVDERQMNALFLDVVSYSTVNFI